MTPERSPFTHRGIVEGFYGPPWSHADRLWWMEQLARLGMNRFVVAPKDDALQRAEWRTPYAADALAQFRELAQRGEAGGVALGLAISPGLSIRYSLADDVRALVAKLRSYADSGARLLCVALDDVPTSLAHAADRAAFRSLAEAHAALLHAAREALGDGFAWWLVPTDYTGREATDYLAELGERLAPEVEVAWTGRTVVAPTIPCSDAAPVARALRRRLLLWDNFPVSDGPMRNTLHFGPYAGRDPALAEHASGVLLNPMQHARASFPAVASAAAYLRDPHGSRCEDAWSQALATLGAGAPEALALFAAAHRFSALTPGERDPALERAFAAVREALAQERDAGAALAAVREQLDLRAAAPAALRTRLADRRLAAELEPWIASHAADTRRMQSALSGLAGVLALPPGLERALAFQRFQGGLTLHAPGTLVSYGPRRACYPQLAVQRDDDARFGSDPVLFRDHSLADEWIRFAEETSLALLAAPEPA